MALNVGRVGPATDLIPLSEQMANHDEYQPDITDRLAGHTLNLRFADGTALTATFESAQRLTWSTSTDLEGRREGTEAYEAVALRRGIVLVVVARLELRVSALAIVDLDHDRVVINLTRLVDNGTGGMKEDTRFLQAGINQKLTVPFPQTTELVGKRVHHRYSSTHAFEHIYLNEKTYAYQGLEGPEAGVADVDLTDTLKIADELYLFSWHERAQPFNGAIALDLAKGRACGRLFGWDKHAGAARQIRTGSIATLLNVTSYEGL